MRSSAVTFTLIGIGVAECLVAIVEVIHADIAVAKSRHDGDAANRGGDSRGVVRPGFREGRKQRYVGRRPSVVPGQVKVGQRCVGGGVRYLEHAREVVDLSTVVFRGSDVFDL